MSVNTRACPITHSLSTAFAADLTRRFETNHDATLVRDLNNQIRVLPLQVKSTVKHGELDKLGTELWNLSTRLRHDETKSNEVTGDIVVSRTRALCLLRAFSFLLLDSAGRQGTRSCPRKSCIRLLKVALKAAKVCINGNELGIATKALERAAEYQDILSQEDGDDGKEDAEHARALRIEYFAIRTTLVSNTVGLMYIITD